MLKELASSPDAAVGAQAVVALAQSGIAEAARARAIAELADIDALALAHAPGIEALASLAADEAAGRAAVAALERLCVYGKAELAEAVVRALAATRATLALASLQRLARPRLALCARDVGARARRLRRAR